MPKNGAVDSGISYAVGGGSIFALQLADVAETAQSLAIILGCALVAIRLISDTIKLYRYLRNKE